MITLDPSFVGKFDSSALSASSQNSLVATAAQSLLDKKDKAKWGDNIHVKQVGVDLPFARMKRVERLGVQGKLDLSEHAAGASDASDDSDNDNDNGDGDVKMGHADDSGSKKKEEKETNEVRISGIFNVMIILNFS